MYCDEILPAISYVPDESFPLIFIGRKSESITAPLCLNVSVNARFGLSGSFPFPVMVVSLQRYETSGIINLKVEPLSLQSIETLSHFWTPLLISKPSSVISISAPRLLRHSMVALISLEIILLLSTLLPPDSAAPISILCT